MAISNITRNLRDGELTIRDDGAAGAITVLLDEGDLTWTERRNTIEIKDRGSIAGGHTRNGDDESVTLSFTAKWTQLVGYSVASVDPRQLYEFLTFQPGAGVESTSPQGEQQTLTFEFNVIDPAGEASERVTFHKVYRETLTMSEGEQANLISFNGRAFQTSPLIERL
ncbi:hypothetical protein AB1L42_23045 [Thalassoglobus sp. JC818]|uniref:hypothetical protein n=1 Tax=Thalassoglobus sp. JC818 TaxID=3232136 RepID=UPI00345B008F